MNRQTTYRIAILGPESTGKSWLAEQLAKRYNTLWVPEYSREYLNGLDREYEYDDILEIARGQLLLEEKMAKKVKGFLFCDTEMITNLIWCMEKYRKCHSWIFGKTKDQSYDLYLLCKPDLPWEPDPLRETPKATERNRLFDLYIQILQEQKLPFAIIEGIGKVRLEMAVQIINTQF